MVMQLVLRDGPEQLLLVMASIQQGEQGPNLDQKHPTCLEGTCISTPFCIKWNQFTIRS
jgi:hypothetical protein